MNTDMSHTKQSHKTKQPHERLPIFNVGINHLQHQNKEKGHIYLFRAVLIKGQKNTPLIRIPDRAYGVSHAAAYSHPVSRLPSGPTLFFTH